tara:strand:- start:303 stop:776 length:474 start_codon:yes stop_codon:yes gene_type:complete
MAGLMPLLATAAEPVLFIDNMLRLDDVIVIEGKTTRFYQQVQLEPSKDGNFKVVGGVEKSLATITEKSVNVLQTTPVQAQLEVSGYMDTPCIQLETAVTRRGDVFYVALAQTPLQTLVACAQVIEPFERVITLDVSDLGFGDYTVLVNNQSVVFRLE